MPAPLFFFAYASSAIAPMSDADLTALLAVSRRNNIRDQLSGLLLYRGGSFLQALEGEEETVRAAMIRIGRDPRHHAVVPLYEGRTEARLFGEWAMAFAGGERLDAMELPGLSTFLAPAELRASPAPFEADGHEVFEFFQAFREYMR
ncbi:MAG: BLUF domain-containing protein [bacterium]